MIERLIDHGNAYEAQGHVLFSVPSDPHYGVLSKRDRDAMVAGARVEVAPYKRDPADFVVWKPSGEGVVGWDSPWGRGRPGWHLECSAMIERHLGETIDIHGGGLDLIFPHHENEIAQSRCVHAGLPLARFWVHNGFVDMGSEKMSKSLGNIVTPAELLEQGHRGETLRLALLSAHYRQPLSWTEDVVAQAKTILNSLYRKVGDSKPAQPDETFVEALSDDLNTPAALARLYQIGDPSVLKASAHLLGLLTDTEAGWFGYSPMRARGRISLDKAMAMLLEIDGLQTTIENLIQLRSVAKSEKKYDKADRIRAFLKEQGIVLEDTAGGTTWRRE
jgi:cysteinyl-tRNA synthetase